MSTPKVFYGANVTAVIDYEHGIPVHQVNDCEDQTLRECQFHTGIYTPHKFPTHGRALQLGKVDEIVLSEVIADLHLLASKAK